jgi:hypothetical protein
VPRKLIYPVPVRVPGILNTYEYHPSEATVGAKSLDLLTVPKRVPPAAFVVL